MEDVNNTTQIRINNAMNQEDHEWLADLWRREWGGDIVVSRGQIHCLDDVNAVIATDGDERVGAATYRMNADGCEIVSINAVASSRGIGTRLLETVERTARDVGCRRVWLITTNDNIDALRFYQRRGYRLARLYPDAIDASRRLKPTIPLIGEHGIPIRDEIELEKSLDTLPETLRCSPS